MAYERFGSTPCTGEHGHMKRRGLGGCPEHNESMKYPSIAFPGELARRIEERSKREQGVLPVDQQVLDVYNP